MIRRLGTGRRTLALGLMLGLVYVVGLGACNAVQGFGQDISQASRATEKAMGGNPDD